MTSRRQPTARAPEAAPVPVPAAEVRDPEAQALEALARGDREAALELLMDGYGSALYRYCRRIVADPDLAADVHQTAFVQAFESLDRFRRRSSLRTWLFGIARHRALDALKVDRRRRRRFHLVEDPPDGQMAAAGADERLLDEGRRAALARCVGELAPRARDAVLLRYQQGLSYPEMAGVTGERPPALHARVVRALPLLRRCMEGAGYGA